MTSAIRARREAEDGFTLIELLVVVIIIGILAAIAIPAFLNQRERAWQAELTSAVRNTALEIEAEATALGGAYPDETAGITAAKDFVDTNVNTAITGAITAGNTAADTGAPVEYIEYTPSPTVGQGFTLCMQHNLLDTASSKYMGGTVGNGLQPYDDDSDC